MEIIKEKVLKFDAQTEDMIVFQVMEEHIKQSKKDFSPCKYCIISGIQKAHKLTLAEVGKVINGFYKKSDNLQGAKIVIKELKQELGIKEQKK